MPDITTALATVAVAALVQPAAHAAHRFHSDHVLGTSMDIFITGATLAESEAARDAAFAEISRLDALLSVWRSDSELARVNASNAPLAVSKEVYDIIAQCEHWRTISDGAFSARLGAVETQWRAAVASNILPDAATLKHAADFADAANVSLDPSTRTIDRAGVVFAPDALAKGYIIDAALIAARRAAPGALGLLLDIGGDLRCEGESPAGGAWRIGVAAGGVAENASLAQALHVSDRATATSGPGARDRIIGATAHSHTLDTRTGAAAPARTVTVVAGKAVDADALATALGIMPIEAALKLAQDNDAEALIQEQGGPAHATPGWTRLAQASACERPLLQIADKPGGKAWPAGFEVGIDYEVPQQSGRAHAPYVAIWITDETGKYLRTLLHLGNRPRRFLDSNYVWWGAFNAAGRADSLDTVTRPSRGPGRYNVIWDGKDDFGKAVGQGKFTINIEASREHGGHSLQTMPLVLGTTPTSARAPAQDESGVAAVRYGMPTT